MSDPTIRTLNSPTINVMLPDGINVQIDPVADVMYIKIREADVSITREQSEGILVDVDKRGGLVGIEILHPARVTLAGRRVVERIARKFHIPAVGRIRPDFLAKGYTSPNYVFA